MTFRTAPFIVFRDGPDVREDLRQALAHAAPEERPGLERALLLVEAQCARSDDEVLARWTASVLDGAGLDAAREHVASVKAVREAAPGLSLVAANRLVQGAAKR
ncbi:hypothetical protein BJP40_11345 [Streptomyces sp. CC53]|uniref:hypothetical protein n=1 Tax=unclassified Streptomyces TaxID=2593676 RepID=UPI0008DE659D|nr:MULTISPECIES: hypothetical protein [unclassified Streptomyces]OII60168.1 hypothetical protein BJP40_11345 [Streptomyces sp. CC53]OII68949.1 hypothetical protein BJP39_19410 [Streptomyces sp. CC77]